MEEKHRADRTECLDWTFEAGARKAVSKFYAIAGSSRECYEELIFSECSGKNVLEYGCGAGSYAFPLANRGASVVGIDISKEAIEIASSRAKEEGLDKVVFAVMDAEATQFEDNSFDMVCGTAILHHLRVDRALNEIVRVLKPEGKAVFIEPMGHNPVINLFRKLTPQFRMKNEHPLTGRDLRSIEQFFHEADFNFFHLFSLIAVPFRNASWFSSFLRILDNLDKTLFERVPLFRRGAWQVVITLHGPKKRG
ncbi:MAG: class I SAM-dependent methyltransferase [Candidatus Eisenbacteria bacterium]|nr:class I SAM-dependent methyltransferase [Candidatus Eisenbacteria bacterium]